MHLALTDNPLVEFYPIPCPSCRKRIDLLHDRLLKHLKEGGTPEEFFDKHNIIRMCCQMHLMSPQYVITGSNYYNLDLIQGKVKLENTAPNTLAPNGVFTSFSGLTVMKKSQHAPNTETTVGMGYSKETLGGPTYIPEVPAVVPKGFNRKDVVQQKTEMVQSQVASIPGLTSVAQINQIQAQMGQQLPPTQSLLSNVTPVKSQLPSGLIPQAVTANRPQFLPSSIFGNTQMRPTSSFAPPSSALFRPQTSIMTIKNNADMANLITQVNTVQTKQREIGYSIDKNKLYWNTKTSTQKEREDLPEEYTHAEEVIFGKDYWGVTFKDLILDAIVKSKTQGHGIYPRVTSNDLARWGVSLEDTVIIGSDLRQRGITLESELEGLGVMLDKSNHQHKFDGIIYDSDRLILSLDTLTHIDVDRSKLEPIVLESEHHLKVPGRYRPNSLMPTKDDFFTRIKVHPDDYNTEEERDMIITEQRKAPHIGVPVGKPVIRGTTVTQFRHT